MFLILLILLILTLISVYKNYSTLSKALSSISVIYMVLRIIEDIVPTMMVFRAGFLDGWVFLWDVLNIVLLTLSAIFIWRKNDKAAKIVLWIMLAVLFLQVWDRLLALYFLIKNLITA